MIRVDTARTGTREPDPDAQTADHTTGCGQPPARVLTGRVCAGTGQELACIVCPHSPSYWRDHSPRAETLRAAVQGPDRKTPPPTPSEPDDDDSDPEGGLW